MYEQASHALLNEILHKLNPEIGRGRLRHFYTRLGANFYAIHTLFQLLYGDRPDFKEQMVSLVETLALRYIERAPHLRKTDLTRERDYNWFLNQKWAVWPYIAIASPVTSRACATTCPTCRNWG